MDELMIILPGIAAISIFFIYYIAKPRLPIKINNVFLALLTAEFLNMILESVALAVNGNFRRTGSYELVYILYGAFYLVNVMRSFLFFVFSCMIVKLFLHKHGIRWLARLPFIAVAVFMFGTMKLGLIYSVVEKVGFQDGPLIFLIPLCSIVYVVLSVVLIVKYRSRISETELLGAIGFNAIELLSALMRIFMPHSLMINLFSFLSIIVCYLSFENPDMYISDRGFAFNKKALRAVLDESIGDNETYRAIGFVLRGYTEERGIYGSEQIDRGVTLISEYLRKQYPKHLIFYLRNGNFVVFDKEALNVYRIHEELDERFRQPWKTRDTDLYLNVSFVKIGAESKIRSADAIIDNMLIALERSSNSATAGNELFDLDTTKDIDDLVRVKKALEQAVDGDKVEIYLQPIIDAETGDITGAESLARIRGEDGGIIPPNDFIPLAEKSGYINLMGEQVFSKVCRFVNSNDFSKTGIKFVNVNLSPVQCMRADLSEKFIGILKKFKAESDRIHLEITEQSIGDSDVIIKQVLNLRSAGFKFCLDDYGSGYSNLTRLKYYPFSNVKLDMEVVRSCCRTKDQLIPNLIKVLKQLGYTITAEGIETEEMAREMKALGCDYLQGYLYSPPIPLNAFVQKYTVKKAD